MSNQKNPTKTGGRRITIAVIIVLVVALAVCIALLVLRSKDTEEPQLADDIPNVSRTVLDRGFVDESNMDDIMSDL